MASSNRRKKQNRAKAAAKRLNNRSALVTAYSLLQPALAIR